MGGPRPALAFVSLPRGLVHIFKRRVPQSLLIVSPSLKRDLRYWVAWHQCHMMHTTTLLRQSLPMSLVAPGARRAAASSMPVWYASLHRKLVQHYPTKDTLRK